MRRKFFQRNSQSAHAGIHFQMHRLRLPKRAQPRVPELQFATVPIPSGLAAGGQSLFLRRARNRSSTEFATRCLTRAMGSPHPATSRPATWLLRPAMLANIPRRRGRRRRLSLRRKPSPRRRHASPPSGNFAARSQAKLLPRLDGSPRGSEFLQLSPLASIIAAASGRSDVTLGLLPRAFLQRAGPAFESIPQFSPNEKFTVICVSTSTGSLFKL